MGHLYAMVGLPGSGKSFAITRETHQQTLQSNTPFRSVVVSGDALRTMLGNGTYFWNETFEPNLYIIIRNMLEQLLPLYDVVFLDESLMTNTTAGRNQLLECFKEHEVTFHWTHAELETCKHRRMKDTKGFHAEVWGPILDENNERFEPLGSPDDAEEGIFVTHVYEITDLENNAE